MKKVLLIALSIALVGFMMVNTTLATVLNEALGIFQNLTDKLGADLGIAKTDGTFDVNLVSMGGGQQLFPGGSATHTVEVQNAGTLDACYRLAFAVQYDAETWPMLNISFSTEETELQQEGGWREITAGGTPYRMMVFTGTARLAAGAATKPVSITIAMDQNVTSAQIGRFRSDFLKTQVLAIDADTFLTATDANGVPVYANPVEALNAALPLNDFNPFE